MPSDDTNFEIELRALMAAGRKIVCLLMFIPLVAVVLGCEKAGQQDSAPASNSKEPSLADALAVIKSKHPDVAVGFSRGEAVAMNTALLAWHEVVAAVGGEWYADNNRFPPSGDSQ